MSKVCRKLNVDCVAAVVGFDAHGGYSFAVMNGKLNKLHQSSNIRLNKFGQKDGLFVPSTKKL